MATTDGGASLTREEWEALPSRFRLPEHGDSPPLLASVPVAELLRRESCARYLDWLGEYIGSPSRRVTASMLAKRYAFLTAAPVLHAMTLYNKGLMLSLRACRLISPDYSGYAGQMTRFPELLVEELRISAPLDGDREEWRDRVLRQLFAGHLSPLFRSLSEAANVPAAILWENAAVRIAPLYEEGAGERHIRDDYEYIARRSPAELFDRRRNPLSVFMGPVADCGTEYAERVRRTCCLYCEMAPEYCRKCPKTGSARA